MSFLFPCIFSMSSFEAMWKQNASSEGPQESKVGDRFAGAWGARVFFCQLPSNSPPRDRHALSSVHLQREMRDCRLGLQEFETGKVWHSPICRHGARRKSCPNYLMEEKGSRQKKPQNTQNQPNKQTKPNQTKKNPNHPTCEKCLGCYILGQFLSEHLLVTLNSSGLNSLI